MSTEVIVNGQGEINALIDSGSNERSFISLQTVKSLGLSIIPENTTVSMASSSVSIPVLGYCQINLELQGRQYKNIKVFVLKDLCTDVILGTDFQSRHKKFIIEYGGPEPELSFCAVTLAKVNTPRLFHNLTADCKPIRTKSRNHSNVDKLFIKQEISSLLEKGIIEPSTSSWRAQVLVAKREDSDKKRLVIDYSQTINKYTQLDAYPLPRIDQMVEELATYSIFSTFDLRSAYHQIPIGEEDKPYTAFEADGKLYQFTRIPFGVTNGVSCFQRTIDDIKSENDLKGTFAYLDNVTVGGKTQVEHDENVKKFLDVCKENNISLNEEKTVYSTTCLNILGYQISKGSLRPDPDRLQALLKLSVPNDLKSLRRIIGLFAYYAKWISNFSEKVHPLNKATSFPLSEDAIRAFETIRDELSHITLQAIDETKPFTVETDASEFAIAATLNQEGKPVAFFSRTLHGSELKRSSVEKEAQSIVEAITKWRHLLLGRHFTLITDQRSVSYMFGEQPTGKIRNDRIQRWRLELSSYSYDIRYRPGTMNVGADTFTRSYCSSVGTDSLKELHDALGHPGITRMLHFTRSKNLAYSINEIRSVTASCRTCLKCKPNFYKPSKGTLIKSTQPFERLNIDFKGPLPSTSKSRYILTIVDEYSRFPWAYPCKNIDAFTVISKLTDLFSQFGMPAYIHSDRGACFMSSELKDFLHNLGVATSRTTPYNPQGNGQVERYNGIIWRTVQLLLEAKNSQTLVWETVLPQALHSIRSLLCTATNETPHERLFNYQRRSAKGTTIPTWLLKPGKVLIKKHVRHSTTRSANGRN